MLRLRVYATGVVLLAACTTGERSITAPPPGPVTDTLTFPDPTGSKSPGTVHFNLVRSAQSNVPASADSALLRITNSGSGFNHIYAAKIPTPGSQTVVSAWVPADTGYVVSVIAFHGGNVLDAVGSTQNPDSSITVLPAGGPIYQNTQVHVDMVPAPISVGFSIADGSHVVAGEHIGWWAQISGPPSIWDDATSTWGCSLNGDGMCSTPSYLALVPNTPGVSWALQVTYSATWGDHTFCAASDTIHVIIDQGSGGIDVTFNKHNH
jgi:hypothetical protein